MNSTRTALITGASSGFGLLTAITLARRGWRVLVSIPVSVFAFLSVIPAGNLLFPEPFVRREIRVPQSRF